MRTSRPCSGSGSGRRSTRLPEAGIRLALSLLLAAVAVSGAARADGDTMVRDAAIASGLVERALASLSVGYAADAGALLDEALSFAPADPDANYLRALLGLSAGETAASAERRLAVSLSSSTFRYHRRADVELLYAAILVRTGRPAEALRFIGEPPRNAQALYLESVARRLIGDAAGARAAVAEALRRFPFDPRPAASWLSAADRPYASAEDRALVAAIMTALPGFRQFDPDILLHLSPYAMDADAARALVREYRALGLRSPAATVHALRLGLIDEPGAVAEAFSGAYVPDMRWLASLYGLLSDDGSRAAFVAAFAAYTGPAVADADRDGFPESWTVYEEGRIVGWVLDANQDREPELRAEALESAPTLVEALSGSSTLVVRYGPWPYAETVRIVDENGMRTYAFAPGALALPLVSLDAVARAGGTTVWRMTRSDAALPSEPALASVAFRVEAGSDGLMAGADLDRGVGTFAWWRDSLGRSGTAWLRAGVPSAESLDLDGDGRTETVRWWTRRADGTVAAAYVEADLDADGVHEYREGLAPPFRKTWDLDGDGAWDVAYETPGGGLQRYEFPSGPGRRPDSSVTFRSATPVSAERRGTALPVVLDSGGRVVWIGSKPFDFGRLVPATGQGARDGIRYAVIEVDGRLFAQVIE